MTGHTNSVASTAFSTDGEMIATGGMDGKVMVWCQVGNENWKFGEFLTELQGPNEVMVHCILQLRKGCLQWQNPCLSSHFVFNI